MKGIVAARLTRHPIACLSFSFSAPLSCSPLSLRYLLSPPFGLPCPLFCPSIKVAPSRLAGYCFVYLTRVFDFVCLFPVTLSLTLFISAVGVFNFNLLFLQFFYFIHSLLYLLMYVCTYVCRIRPETGFGSN